MYVTRIVTTDGVRGVHGSFHARIKQRAVQMRKWSSFHDVQCGALIVEEDLPNELELGDGWLHTLDEGLHALLRVGGEDDPAALKESRRPLRFRPSERIAGSSLRTIGDRRHFEGDFTVTRQVVDATISVRVN